MERRNFGEVLVEVFPHIFEKIIRYAIERESRNVSLPEDWLVQVQKYGRVSAQWKAAILSSRNLFKPSTNFPGDPFCGPSNHDIILASSIYLCSVGPFETVKQLLDDGYFRVAKRLIIGISDPFPSSAVSTRVLDHFKSHAAGNQIEQFDFSHDTVDPWPVDTISAIVNILNMSNKVQNFNFIVEVHDQEAAEQCWKLLHAAATCNELPKMFIIENNSIGGFWFNPSVDWSFTSQTAHANTGLIKRLNVRMLTQRPLDFSHLGRIETLKVNYTWFEHNHALISQMEVKELEVVIDIEDMATGFTNWQRPMVRHWRDDLFITPHDESYQWPIYPATHKVTFTYIYYRNYEEINITNTFECGNTLWENVRRWMNNVQYQLEQLDGIHVVMYQNYPLEIRRMPLPAFMQI